MTNMEPRKLLTVMLFVVIIGGAIIGIYNYQVNYVKNRTPQVEITKPDQDAEVTASQIVLQGKASKDSKVKVSGQEVAVASDGKFDTEVALREGLNLITVEASYDNGQTARLERRVTRVIPGEAKQEAGEAAPSEVTNKVVVESDDLSTSGPESFWIPEAMALAGAGTAFLASRKKVKKANSKN